MIKRMFIFVMFAVLTVTVMPAFAARQIRIYSSGGIGGELFDPSSCATLQNLYGPNNPTYPAPFQCDTAAMDAAIKAGSGSFNATAKNGMPLSNSITSSGSCSAGADAGSYDVWSGYVSTSTGAVLQYFGVPRPFSLHGCMVQTQSSGNCFTHPSDGEVAPGVAKAYCTWPFVETGDTGGSDGEPDVDEQPYTGNGTGGGNTGGGNTGGGNTGGGNTGGGNTGGGNTGGGNTGGGNTGGGSTGGGNTGGGNTGGGSTGGGSADFCALHPTSMVCLNSSVSGGCGASFSCTGDAIQCATLREVHDANCKVAADEAAASQSGIGKLGQGVIDGNDPDGNNLPTPANGAQLSVPALDQSGWLGGGECFTDKTFLVLGRQITIPFSRTCSALIIFRYAIMIVALLASFKMLAGAVIRE